MTSIASKARAMAEHRCSRVELVLDLARDHKGLAPIEHRRIAVPSSLTAPIFDAISAVHVDGVEVWRGWWDRSGEEGLTLTWREKVSAKALAPHHRLASRWVVVPATDITQRDT